MSHIVKWRSVIIAGVLFLALSGCASIRPGPFRQFNEAVTEAGAGIDAAITMSYEWTRLGFASDFASDTASKFSQLIVQPGENYTWSMTTTPLYFKIKKARSTLLGLNLAFSRYAALLLKLSGADLINEKTFDLMTVDLNKNVGDALGALGDSSLSVAPTALISTAFVEAAKLFIVHKRRSSLAKAIEQNQENVRSYSDLCVSIIHTMRANIKTYYADNYELIKKSWNADKAGEKRQKHTEAMLTLNDRFIDALGLLQVLEATYKAFPIAHADLSMAAKKSNLNLDGVRQLFSSGKHLQMLYNELNKN
jgi:hypothetical protein